MGYFLADDVLQFGGRFDDGGGFSGCGMSIEGELTVGEGDARSARAWLLRSTVERHEGVVGFDEYGGSVGIGGSIDAVEQGRQLPLGEL